MKNQKFTWPKFSNAVLFGLLFGALILCIAIISYSGNDDKYITFAAADALASGNGFRNINGEIAEQSSSLIFSLLLASITVLTGYTAPFIAYFVGIACYLLLTLLTCRLFRSQNIPVWMALLPFFTIPALYWAGSAMENSLYLLIWVTWLTCAFSIFQGQPKTRPTPRLLLGIVILSALLTGTRPEAPFVIVMVAALWGLALGNIRKTIYLSMAAILGISLMIGLRLAMGLELFPLPVYIKTGGSHLAEIQQGLLYFASSAGFLPTLNPIYSNKLIILILPIIVFFAISRSTAPVVRLGLGFLSLAAAIFTFSIMSGGDWMPAYRFLTPLYFCLIAAMFLIVDNRKILSVFTAVFVVCIILDVKNITSQKYMAAPLYAKFVSTEDGIRAAPLDRSSAIQSRDVIFTEYLIDVINQDPRDALTLASVQAGFVPYWLLRATEKDIHFIDLRGLTTTDLHNCEALPNLWKYKPYKNLPQIESCAQRKIDYIYDLSRRGYQDGVVEFGCEVVVDWKTKLSIPTRELTYNAREFVARC